MGIKQNSLGSIRQRCSDVRTHLTEEIGNFKRKDFFLFAKAQMKCLGGIMADNRQCKGRDVSWRRAWDALHNSEVKPEEDYNSKNNELGNARKD